jgi:F-type H+-transporting ATPase subunit epsilon
MAEEKVQFELVSPEKLLFSEGVDMVVVPGSEGDFGVLPRHAPLLSTVRPGVIRVYNDGQVSEEIFVDGGFAEVTTTRCTVLAQEALPIADIDKSAAESALKDAREDLEDAKDENQKAEAERQIAINEAKLKVS